MDTVDLKFEDYSGPVQMPAGGCASHPDSFSVVMGRAPRTVLCPCYQCWKDARVRSRQEAASAAERKAEAKRAVLTAAVEWGKAVEEMASLDHELGVSVMLNERIDPERPRRLAQLKAAEFGKRNVLRKAVDSLARSEEGGSE